MVKRTRPQRQREGRARGLHRHRHRQAPSLLRRAPFSPSRSRSLSLSLSFSLYLSLCASTKSLRRPATPHIIIQDLNPHLGLPPLAAGCRVLTVERNLCKCHLSGSICQSQEHFMNKKKKAPSSKRINRIDLFATCFLCHIDHPAMGAITGVHKEPLKISIGSKMCIAFVLSSTS